MNTVLADSVLRVLSNYGPQDFFTLEKRLRHGISGKSFFQEPYFEAKLRQVLKSLSEGREPSILQSSGYRWELLKEPIEDQCSEPQDPPAKPIFSMGKGRESVYGIYCPADLNAWLGSHRSKLPIKIGKTRRLVEERRLELQTGTYFRLEVGFIVQTDDSHSLENFLHNVLVSSRIANSQQNEWFMTTFDEIHSAISKHLLSIGVAS